MLTWILFLNVIAITGKLILIVSTGKRTNIESISLYNNPVSCDGVKLMVYNSLTFGNAKTPVIHKHMYNVYTNKKLAATFRSILFLFLIGEITDGIE